MKERKMVSNGLKLMFIGQIVGLLGFLPFVGWLLRLVGAVVGVVGLVQCARGHGGYQYALIALVVGTVCGLFTGNFVFTLAVQVCSVLQVYFVCTTTDAILVEEGVYNIRTKGERIWKIFAVCAVVSVALNVLLYVPILNILAALAAVVITIVGVIAGVMYILYLYRCSVQLG